MAEPTSSIDWTEGNPNQATISVEPTAAKKEAGWLTDERPPKETMNWLFQNLDEWTKHFKAEIDAFSSQSIIYDAFVGAGGSHVDINALMADPAIATLKNILIVSMISLDVGEDQIINADGKNFYFKAGAGFTKLGPTGAIRGLVISADRIRIHQARLVGFNIGGDHAIEISAGQKNNFVTECSFSDNDNEINDIDNNNNVKTGNMVEV